VYETFLQPLVMQYQPNIEARLQYLRANAGDILVFYLKNFTERGYDLFLRVLDYVRSQASKGSRTRVYTPASPIWLYICSFSSEVSASVVIVVSRDAEILLVPRGTGGEAKLRRRRLCHRRRPEGRGKAPPAT